MRKNHRKVSQSNGFVEKAIQEVEGVIRTLMGHVEDGTKEKIDRKGAFMTWLIEHAGNLITRYKVGSDGATPYQRVKGKAPSNAVMPIGERVLYMPPKADKVRDERGKKVARTKADYRYVFGVYLGIKQDSNDSWIGTEGGEVIAARSLRRTTDEEKWSMDAINKVKGVPWDLKGERDGEAP